MQKCFLSVALIFLMLETWGYCSPQEVAKGRQFYLSYGCAVCHGKDGDGKGISASPFYPTPTDFHNLDTYTNGYGPDRLRYAIKYGLKQGNSTMPAFDHIPEKQIDAMVDYLVSLQPKPSTQEHAP